MVSHFGWKKIQTAYCALLSPPCCGPSYFSKLTLFSSNYITYSSYLAVCRKHPVPPCLRDVALVVSSAQNAFHGATSSLFILLFSQIVSPQQYFYDHTHKHTFKNNPVFFYFIAFFTLFLCLLAHYFLFVSTKLCAPHMLEPYRSSSL